MTGDRRGVLQASASLLERLPQGTVVDAALSMALQQVGSPSRPAPERVDELVGLGTERNEPFVIQLAEWNLQKTIACWIDANVLRRRPLADALPLSS